VNPIYTLPISEAFQSLESAPTGLSPAEAQARLTLYGRNVLAEPAGIPVWHKLLTHTTHPIALLLWVAGGLIIVGGRPLLGLVIWIVVLVNASFSLWQEYRAGRAVATLKQLLPAYTRVIRAGVEAKLPVAEVAPGDVLILAEGDNIPADARVVEEYGLRVNNSALNGEALPARKTAEASLRDGLTEVERPNLVFAGTSVVSGTGRVVVFATGMLTQFGRIASLTQSVKEAPSALQKEIARAARITAWIAFGLGILVFVDGLWEVRLPLLSAFTFAIGVIVAVIPEGLLPTVTLSLAMAVQRLARRGVLVKRLSTVERLGATSVICTDKSGTLTQNQMTVREVWVAGHRLEVSGVGYEPKGAFTPALPEERATQAKGVSLRDLPTKHPERSAAAPSTSASVSLTLHSASAQDAPPRAVEGAISVSLEGMNDGGLSEDLEADLHALLIAATLCNNSRLNPPSAERPQWTCLGDQTEAALRVVALKGGVDEQTANAAYPRVHELPFDARRKRMSTIHVKAEGGTLRVKDEEDSAFTLPPSSFAVVKGAPKEVLQLCTHILVQGETRPLDNAMRTEILAANDDCARRVLRVLALARRELPPRTGAYTPEGVEQNLTFLGLLAMMDPPRPEVAAAIQTCHAARIRLVIITGDYGLTAESLAKRVGLLKADTPRILTGAEVEALNDIELETALAEEIIFARMAPEHKLRVVAALQRRGEVVAVTGDGVNDAPALRKADIGIAMGVTGTDVAKEAAHVILTDDNFAAIVGAIEEGRAVYDNLRKFVTYIFASNVPEVMPFILTALFRIPLALTVTQLLAIDLGTDLLPALALGTERPEPDVMRRSPRRFGQSLLDRGLFLRAFLWLGLIETVLCYAGFFLVYYWSGYVNPFTLPRADLISFAERLTTPAGLVYILATTVFHAGVVTAQIGNAFTCRTEKGRVYRLGLFSNRFLLVGIGFELALILALIYLPPLATLFEHRPLPLFYWGGLLLYAPVVYGLDRMRKSLARRVDQGRERKPLKVSETPSF